MHCNLELGSSRGNVSEYVWGFEQVQIRGNRPVPAETIRYNLLTKPGDRLQAGPDSPRRQGALCARPFRRHPRGHGADR